MVLVAWMSMVADAQAPAAEKSAGRTEEYIDLRAGFRVTLPSGLERQDMRSASQVVSWTHRDRKTGAIDWTISVNSMRAVGGMTMRQQMDDITATLKEKEHFEIESATIIKVGQDDAIDVKGTVTVEASGRSAGKVQWWQRQVWVRHGEKFLTWRITGPAQAEAEMNKVMTALLGTLTLIDAKQALAEREKNLAAGTAWLAKLNAADLAKRIQAVPEQWFAVTQDDKTVGWAVLTFEADATGVTTRLFISTESGDVSSSAHATFDRTSATGAIRYRFPAKSWQMKEQSALNRGTLSVTEFGDRGNSRTRTKQVPTDTFLPAAMVQALPLLVDRTKPVTMSFAVNTPQDPRFDVCTVRVGEERELAVGDKTVKAVPIEVQQAEDKGADVYWLTADNTFPRVESANGYRMTLSTKAAILKKFPNAKPE